MSSFDAAMALSQDQLNQMLAIIYQKVFPHLFSGSKTVNEKGIEYVEWVISAAPQFNLSAGSDGSTFEITFTGVGAHLERANNGGPIVYQLSNVRAVCTLKVSGDTISFIPQQATCDPLSDPTQQFFAELVFMPAVQTALEGLMSGLALPAITFSGVDLSGPSAVIVDNHLVVAVNLASKGVPGPAPAGSWTPSGFSLLVSQDLMQAGVAGQGMSFSHSAVAGSKLGGYEWSYSLKLDNPTISGTGTTINLAFAMSCSINAAADVEYTSVNIGIGASVSPNPSAVCALVVNGGSTELVAQSVPPFTIKVAPTGSVPPQVADWITQGIAITLVNSIVPAIRQYLGGIQVGSIAIPTFTEQVDGTTIALTPTNLVQSTVNGYTAFGGTLAAE